MAIFVALCSFGPPPPCSGGYHMERGGMPLHDAPWDTVKRAQLLKIKAQVLSIWAKGCILMTVCVLSDST